MTTTLLWLVLPVSCVSSAKRGGGLGREKSAKEGKREGKLLNDWRNFDLPKLMPVEHISLMPSSCLSLTNTHQGTRQWVTHHGSAIQEFADASVRSNEQKGLLIAGVPYHLSPIPLFYPFLPIPYPFRCLLRRLCSLGKFVWHVLHNSTTAFCAWVKAQMNDSAQSWPKPEISSWPSLFKHKGGIFSLSSQESFDAAKTIH